MADRSEITVPPLNDALPLVGRSTELSALSALVDAAIAGQARAALIRGPAGIGKTRLVNAVVEAAAGTPATVLRTTCYEVTSGVGYGAVRALFAPLGLGGDRAGGPSGGDRDAGGRAHLLDAGAKWALPALLPEAQVPDSGGRDASYPVLHGLYWLAVNVMSTGPLVIVVDDVHWCDERTLRWLDFLLRRADGLPLLVLLAQRTGTAGPNSAVLAEILAQPSCEILDVRPLAERDVADLAALVLRAPVDPEFQRCCAEVTAGNPLLLTRLLGELSWEGVRPTAAGVRRAAEVGRNALAASVLPRLAGQPDHVQAVARAAAVLGGAVDQVGTDLLAALAGVPPQLATSAVRALRQLALIAPGQIDFEHDALRSLVLAEHSPDEVERLRVRAARLLNDAGRPAEEVANQLLLLSQPPQPWMLGVLRDAALRAEHRGAPEAAVRYLSRVLDASQDPAEQTRARVELARPLALTDPFAALGHLRQALADLPDVRARVPVVVRFALTALATQRALEAVGLLTAALDEFPTGPDSQPGDQDLRALLEATLVLVGSDEKSTIGTVREWLRRLPPPAGNSPAERQILGMTAVLSAAGCSPASEVVELANRTLRAGTANPSGWAAASAALALQLADEVTPALAAFDRLLVDSREQAAAWMHCVLLASRGVLQYGIGDIAEAAADAQTAVHIAEQEIWRRSATMPFIVLAYTLVERDDPDRAEAALARVDRPRFDEFVWEWHYFLHVNARLRWLRGDLDGALEHLLRCQRSLAEAEITNPVFVPWWVDAACIHAQQGHPERAVELVDQARDLARQWGTPRGEGLGLLAAGVLSGGARAVDLLEQAVEVLARSPARLDHAHAHYRLGRALLDVDDARGARRQFRQAVDLAARCGSQAISRVASNQLVAAGGRLHREIRTTVDTLTGAEHRVAALAAGGASNREIAEALFVTVRTVEVHLTNVYRKLGVTRRTELPAVLGNTSTTGAHSRSDDESGFREGGWRRA
ncbi:helix-turn-helix transcriptional regulator [Goodfellowiella coeruleoviolacea]|uniref:helix-turn-helix transcriptional regulator n=1 Tax=Goodfellowiella coeruleoviolacea TaxID=334858 RepID=UPI0020A5A1A5|nr:AAA family ATPase [Goodfellowiella coeruleoviolacea]